MKYTHLLDDSGKVVACSTAGEWTDYDGQPIGLGFCEHIDEFDGVPLVVECPFPVLGSGTHRIVIGVL